ncbi:hypothetical protein [Stella sp.]|uniref:hypothetical protein n=1 Tax=Stella sp. TaxID=2912054 RepID=UPI0035B21A8D
MLLAGALQSLLETGTVLRSLEIELGQPELEAILYNLILRIEAAGPVGLVLAWLFGLVVILVVRRVLLALVGAIWDATATWAQGPRPPVTSAPHAPPARHRPPWAAGPWARQAPAQSRDAAASAPPAPGPPGPGPAAPPRRPATPVRRPLVERTDSRRDAPPGEAGVVLQRPRGHMDGS